MLPAWICTLSLVPHCQNPTLCLACCAAYNDKPYPAKCGSFSYKPSTKRCNFHRFDSYNGNPDGGNFPSFCKDSAYEAGSVTTN